MLAELEGHLATSISLINSTPLRSIVCITTVPFSQHLSKQLVPRGGCESVEKAEGENIK